MATIFQIIFAFLVIGILMYFAFRKSSGCCGGHESGDSGGIHRNPSTRDDKGRDPVCRMEVDTSGNPLSSTHQSRTVYFCSTHCKERFDRNPEQYAGSQETVHQGHGGCCA